MQASAEVAVVVEADRPASVAHGHLALADLDQVDHRVQAHSVEREVPPADQAILLQVRAQASVDLDQPHNQLQSFALTVTTVVARTTAATLQELLRITTTAIMAADITVADLVSITA